LHKYKSFEENTLLHAVKATATEESQAASRLGKILRRPMIAYQTTEFGVGLLRMTSFVPFP
jgi:hypothetical protein